MSLLHEINPNVYVLTNLSNMMSPSCNLHRGMHTWRGPDLGLHSGMKPQVRTTPSIHKCLRCTPPTLLQPDRQSHCSGWLTCRNTTPARWSLAKTLLITSLLDFLSLSGYRKATRPKWPLITAPYTMQETIRSLDKTMFTISTSPSSPCSFLFLSGQVAEVPSC